MSEFLRFGFILGFNLLYVSVIYMAKDNFTAVFLGGAAGVILNIFAHDFATMMITDTKEKNNGNSES